jgi:putative acetyltransferase
MEFARMSEIDIEIVMAPTAELRELVAELDATLAADYAPEQRHGLSLDALFAPHMRFFVAHVDGRAVGCGGVALFADFAEVKRMYVRPMCRGTGIAPALLARIEAETIAAGLDVLRLETGIHAHAAIRMYERAGFGPCPVFGAYASMSPAAIATSVFLEKRLSPGS